LIRAARRSAADGRERREWRLAPARSPDERAAGYNPGKTPQGFEASFHFGHQPRISLLASKQFVDEEDVALLRKGAGERVWRSRLRQWL